MQWAWLFPGQGAQFVGMGKDVMESSVAARQVFERADAALGEPLSRLVLEGPEDVLTMTANAQPAIVTVSIAILAALKEQYPNLPAPRFAAGHSLGEYSALVAAGALTLEDAVRLVRARGQAMQESVPADVGAMAAIMGVEPDRLATLCEQAAQGEVVSCANFNAPGQIVVAGHKAAVGRVSELVSAERGKAIPLKVSAPFHCALMLPAAKVVETRLGEVSLQNPAFPVVANFDARPNADAHRVKELLVRQVDGAVRWQQAVEFMRAEGITKALEIGPGKVLSGLVKRIDAECASLTVLDPATLAEGRALLA